MIPPIDPENTEKTVEFYVSRDAGDSNTVTFTKRSGSGPNQLTFGPNGGYNVTAQIGTGAVYERTSFSASGGRGLSFRLSGITLEVDDNFDSDFTDLRITPRQGRFTSDSRWAADW